MKKINVLAVVFFLLFVTGNVFGAAFQLIEQNVSGLGNAFAGGAAIAEDASTIFYNPAGLTRISTQASFSAHVIMPSAKYRNQSASRIIPFPLTGENGGDAGVTGYVPNLYIAYRLNEKTGIGLGVNVPFGLATDYPENWVGRYHALKSDVKTVNINPAVAYKITDKLSLGVGLNVQKVEAELSNAIDQKLILAIAGAPVAIWSTAPDGFAKLEGNSWAYGYNAGLLYEFTKDIRLGISYRSKIDHDLDGYIEFSKIHPLLVSNPRFQKRAVKADITLPRIISASFYAKLNPKVALMADVSQTGWNAFKELRIKDDLGNTVSLTKENWENTMRYSIGLSYYATDKLTYRLGVAYDETPVPSAEYRTPRIPDGDRRWVSAGLGYKFAKNLSIDLGAAYLFVNTPEIDKRANPLDPTNENNLRGNLKGSYDADVKILSAQLNWNF